MNNRDKPAFATEGIYDKETIGRGSANGLVVEPQRGLTKREYFAAMAMQGTLMAIPTLTPSDIVQAAQISVEMADALLGELDKKTP